jgi:hypothetical protein
MVTEERVEQNEANKRNVHDILFYHIRNILIIHQHLAELKLSKRDMWYLFKWLLKLNFYFLLHSLSWLKMCSEKIFLWHWKNASKTWKQFFFVENLWPISCFRSLVQKNTFEKRQSPGKLKLISTYEFSITTTTTLATWDV